MRYMGIDYGSRRVGVAVSDESAGFAFPHSVIINSDHLINDIKKICDDQNVGGVVVGESRDYSQKENKIMEEILPFVENLKKSVSIPVFMHPEFMTSAEAEHLQGKNEMHDASAASLILKSFLDTHINNKK